MPVPLRFQVVIGLALFGVALLLALLLLHGSAHPVAPGQELIG